MWSSNYNYIITYQKESSKDLALDHSIQKFIARYFFSKGKIIKFFEPYTRQLQTTLIYGTAPISTNGVMERNMTIFKLELFAHLQDPTRFEVSEDYPQQTKVINGITVTIYKIKKLSQDASNKHSVLAWLSGLWQGYHRGSLSPKP